MDGEIGVEWMKVYLNYSEPEVLRYQTLTYFMKNFETRTQGQANGHTRLLFVDGHNSHYTRGFLEHARLHNIIVLCYPAHATHIYQGLDVVIFSVLKRQWTQVRDEYEAQTGEQVSKEKLYGKAHILAVTEANIRTAFRVTSI